MKKTLTVFLLSDGIPGHVNQAKGLLGWLSREYIIESHELAVKLKIKSISRGVSRYCLNHTSFNAVVFSFYQHNIDLDAKPDLIISAGGNTSFLNAALARFWQIPNIFIGSLRRLNPDLFTVILTLEAVENGVGHQNNIVMDFAPTLIDPEKIRSASGAYLENTPVLRNKTLWLLVIGGDGAGFKYDRKDWEQLANNVNRLSREYSVEWLITSSRRTGREAELILNKHIRPCNIAEAVWWNDKPKKVMLPYLGMAQKVFVTADSMSMITECFSSGTNTIALYKPTSNVDARYQAALDKLSKKYIQLQVWSDVWELRENEHSADMLQSQFDMCKVIIKKLENEL